MVPAGLVTPLPARIRYRIITSRSPVVVALARSICGIEHRVVGDLSKGRPDIFMSKHQSAWETLASQVLPPPQVLAPNRWLPRLPFFGRGLATLSPITVDAAGNARTLRRLLVQERHRLAQGFWVIVFPEGARVRPGKRARYKAGGARLVCNSEVSVGAVAHNAGELWPKNGFGKYPGTITVSIDAPSILRD